MEQKVQTSFKKAKEAEDASTPLFRPMMRRSYSFSQFDPMQKTEKEECEARSGALWKCIRRKPSRFGGHIYLFKIKNKYNDFTDHPNQKARISNLLEQSAAIFPAIESWAQDDILSYDVTFDIEKRVNSKVEALYIEQTRTSYDSDLDVQERKNRLRKDLESKIRENLTRQYEEHSHIRKNVNFLQQLGYRFSEKNGQVFKEAPDREALLGAYHNLKETHPERPWPDFEINSSDGIASDDSYARAHFTGGLLSNGPEFVHDHDVHIITRLHRIFEGVDYYQKTERELVQSIFSVYRKIYMAQEQDSRLKQHSEKLNFLLGMTTDTLFAALPSFLEQINNEVSIKIQINDICEDPYWKRYVQRRFPKDTPTDAKMIALWEQVEQAADDFVQARNVAKLTGDLTQLNASTKTLIQKNPKLFLRLEKEGFFFNDLAKFDKNFLEWIIQNPDSFLELKKQGLPIHAILDLNLDQQKNFDELMELSKYAPLQDLLTLKNSCPLEIDFDKDFWSLSRSHKTYLLKHPEALHHYNAVGIFMRDIIIAQNTSLDRYCAEEYKNLKLLKEKGISVAGFSSQKAKWLTVECPEDSIRFLEFGISMDVFVRLGKQAQMHVLLYPNQLQILMQTGIAIEKIAALSNKVQKELIVYSKYLVSEITQETSVEELAHLAKQGPIRNEEAIINNNALSH